MNRELYLSSISDNGAFALEYYFQEKPNKSILLEEGIEYCKLFRDASSYDLTKNISYEELDEFEKIKTIQKHYTKEKLEEYKITAMEIMDVLRNILKNDKITITEEKIRSYQHFFNETSLIFTSAEMRKIHRRQELREQIRKV